MSEIIKLSVSSTLEFGKRRKYALIVCFYGWLSAFMMGSAAHAETENAPSGAAARAPVNPCRQMNDAETGPLMIAISPGRFLMGAPFDEMGRFSNEGPQHEVAIAKSFAISRCEITVGQFRQFVDDSEYQTSAETDGKGCKVWDSQSKAWKPKEGANWRNPGFEQTDDHPVVCVSWRDAQRYVEWLAQHTENAPYRLPTEAEWEYAARAGTESPRYFGGSPCEYANGAGQEAKGIGRKSWSLGDCADGFVHTAPVGHFKPNDFGLFDALGNVGEWTLDCWHVNYWLKPPKDAAPWLEASGGNCGLRVVRGGSWFDSPPSLRSAFRHRYDAGDANADLGFRVAIDL